MIIFFLYMLKVSICLIVFYIFFFLVLRKNTFFLLNRFYLIVGLLLSFVIPVLKFSFFNGSSNFPLSTLMNMNLMEPDSDFFQIQNVPNDVISINYLVVLSVIYIIGIFILFFKLLLSIFRIIRIKNSSGIKQSGKIKIVETESSLPFSFFNMIFLPKDERNPFIIEHEIAHIKQFHWFDLILIEIASVLLWFNPFVVLYKNSIKLLHEFLADDKVIRNSRQVENYLGCMLQQVQKVSSIGFVSHFYCKTIKKRIDMITKNKTSIKYLGVYLLAIPLACLLLLAFTNNHYKTVLNLQNEVSLNTDVYTPSIYPVNLKKVTRTNGYGERIHPFTKKKDFHRGIDFALAEGEVVMATAKGTIIEAKFDEERKKGNYILMKHNDVYSTFYSQLKSVAVKKGDKIERGQVIGYVGSTGLSTGPHLHYEVIKNGERVDPKDYLPK